jgi:prepilin-type N-terminal cleavage/methylation domain-containing protein/prepilin-type processing-associated H-X9-DG protein
MMRWRTGAVHSHRGFSLVELMAVVGILCIVIALALPAVQSAREAARNAQCKNNLHQFGLALHAYVDANRSFPTAANNHVQPDGSMYLGLYSVHARLLPYLDQPALFSTINFECGAWPPDSYHVSLDARTYTMGLINATASRTGVALFLCPSDGGAFRRTGNNYRGNVGVGPSFSTLAETPDSGNGLFPETVTVSPSWVTDGLSHTVAFSERVRGSGREPPIDPERDMFQRMGIVNTADQLLKACRIAARPSNQTRGYTESGQFWFWTGRERTLYNHAQAPNGSIPDCTYGGITPAIDMATARSRHPGGVNCVMADGSGRFVTSGIAQAVWRGLGTRGSGELVD